MTGKRGTRSKVGTNPRNQQQLESIRQDVCSRIKRGISLDVQLPNVTNATEIKYISFQHNRNNGYILKYYHPVYFPVATHIGSFGTKRIAAEVQLFINNKIDAISNELTPVSNFAHYNTKLAKRDWKTNKLLPNVVKVKSNGDIIPKPYTEYVEDQTKAGAPVRSRTIFDTHVRNFNNGRASTPVDKNKKIQNWNRGNKFKKDRYDFFREENKSDVASTATTTATSSASTATTSSASASVSASATATTQKVKSLTTKYGRTVHPPEGRGHDTFPKKKAPKREYRLLKEDTDNNNRPMIGMYR
mmetsp:Transcript_51859/g.52828  ORF Transcript_51859/g.52828 Transcript_51859/m.52828 type:complete len:302 (-) Transcript_51859:20-925(-)